MNADEKIQRLIRPDELSREAPMFWSPGRGTDLWALICAAIAGDLPEIDCLLQRDPALVRASYDYRGALAFAVRENQVAAAARLLAGGASPTSSGTSDTLLQIARDRGYTEMAALLTQAIASSSRSSESESSSVSRSESASQSASESGSEAESSSESGANANANANANAEPGSETGLTSASEPAARPGIDLGADPGSGPGVASDLGPGPAINAIDAIEPPGASEPSAAATLQQAEALAAAIRARDGAAVRRLLDAAPALVHARDASTNLPMHWAVMTRQIDLVDDLLARGADIDAPRRDGARPIQLANGDYGYRGWRDVPADVTATPRDLVAHLRSRGAACDIATAAYTGDADRVRELLDADPSLANKPSDYITYYPCSGSPLRNAAEGGHIDIVRLLLARGADPNLPEEGIAPLGHALHSAVCRGHLEIVRLLLAHGAHPNVPIESSADTLSAAIARNDRAMIDLLCSHGAARSLPLLAYVGDVQTAAAMLAANPALADDVRALENAASEGHEPVVRLLLHHRPDLATRIAVGVRSRGPMSPIAARALAELLFERGMDPNRPDWQRVTPLHRMAERGDLEMAALFIDRGADVNARDEEWRSTPLGYAARAGQTEMAALLLSRGAQPALPDDLPWATPLAWATRRGHDAIVRLLQAHASGPADTASSH